MNNSAKRITVSLAGWQLYLLPGDLRELDISAALIVLFIVLAFKR